MTIRCIQIGTTIVQGEAVMPACENCPGWDVQNCVCTDYAEVSIDGKKFTGKLVPKMQEVKTCAS